MRRRWLLFMPNILHPHTHSIYSFTKLDRGTPKLLCPVCQLIQFLSVDIACVERFFVGPIVCHSALWQHKHPCVGCTSTAAEFSVVLRGLVLVSYEPRFEHWI